MMNLHYEVRICQKIYNRVTMTVYVKGVVWFNVNKTLYFLEPVYLVTILRTLLLYVLCFGSVNNHISFQICQRVNVNIEWLIISMLYISSSFELLGVESNDFSHAEKERAACKAKGAFTNYVYKIWLFLTTYPPPFTFSMV